MILAATYRVTRQLREALGERIIELAGVDLESDIVERDPSDPRYALYSQLYALTISYDCTGEPVCLTIPQPTTANPVGVPFGTNMKITADDLMRFGIIDQVIPEPIGGAHREPKTTIASAGEAIAEALAALDNLPPQEDSRGRSVSSHGQV